MSIEQSQDALDALVQQTWKRARTAQEIGSFITGHLAALDEVDSEELDIDIV